MSHDHGEMSTPEFALVTVLNAVITVAEIVSGLFSGSLGLVSDGFHNMEDTLSVVLSFAAHVISQKDSNERQTFGYRRAEILAAFINSVILIAITIVLALEGLQRLFHPQKVNGNIMFWVAVVSFVANLTSTLIMLQGSKHNLNIKATFLHMAADAVTSLSVIVAALLVKVWHWYWADPVITLLTSVWIMKESWSVVKQAVAILMEASPKLDLKQICQRIQSLPEVISVHHVHLWRIDEQLIAFDAHINVAEDESLSQLELLYQKISQILQIEFGIEHVTLQPEYKHGLKETLVHQKVNKK
ncbi:cation diffusion facilitator family transporter [Bombilactobacillus folatiphilus]|uniref:Cation diffusion facilitator family transporter n=1 Tax=Bombilactobacillus folatiphilus TaxID=2923362 RepID=A0ABY4PA14_9LACO|nr:cation diffusion facilitator family transporter [Bombilactobacillus folatiphilus]UQS82389.1 cation diffusion facilitator family transporter [Bombilactobacillus folatiphilus]